ncbi:MAG: uracil-DNA glycosylase [Candidatus Sericytochromatia bacterium]|nr:uracil-DNA glycosylase [Candidatus Sericytochromatia bacterium]
MSKTNSPLWQDLPTDWQKLLAEAKASDWWQNLASFVEAEYAQHTIYPPRSELFQALRLTPVERVKVVILGQDPYPGAGQAHGLSFSVAAGVPLPRSLKNIYRELSTDLNLPVPTEGCLNSWAEQGVLLLNTVLTVRAGASYSHRKQGWERLTDLLLKKLAEREAPCAFLLWGNPARAKKAMIQAPQHLILESAHPSPLSAHQGFWSSRPFSTLNHWLETQGQTPIRWQIT